MIQKEISAAASNAMERQSIAKLGGLVASLCMFLVASQASAQSSQGWLSDFLSGDLDIQTAPNTLVGGTHLNFGDVPSEGEQPANEDSEEPLSVNSFAGTSSAPDEVTPEIASLTQGVINGYGSYPSWFKCFLFVNNQIEYEHYYGCKKGALLTYLERKGGDADLAALLVAMLRSAGYTARYGYGMVAFPTANDPDGYYIQSWLGTPASTTTINNYCLMRGFPAFYADGGNNCYMHRVWAEVKIGGTWYRLDAAFKKRTRITPSFNASTVSGYSRAALKIAAGGTTSINAIEGIDYTALGNYLTARASALISYIDANASGADAASVLGGWAQVPFLNASGGQDLLFGGYLQPARSSYWDAPQTYDSLPSSLLSTVTVEVRSTAAGAPLVASYTAPLANLQGRRLSLTFNASTSSGQAQLWLDDTLLGQESTAAAGTSVNLKISIHHPHSNSLNGNNFHDQVVEKAYLRGASYALVYSFNPTEELLKARQNVLDNYRRSGLADTSRQVITESLNIIGLTWLHETELAKRVLGGNVNCDTLSHHRMGRVCQENGYYIDVDVQYDGTFALDGSASSAALVQNSQLLLQSAMEHGVIEQMQGISNPAVSTIKLLRMGNQQPSGSGKTFYATPSTWSAVSVQLQGYSDDDKTKLQAVINQGGEMLLPQKGSLALNQWTGAGYIARINSNNVTTIQMLISGGLHGGYATIPTIISTPWLTTITNSNPLVLNTTPIVLPRTLSYDPIDLATGDYFYPTTDLEIGAAAPRGLTFSRQYHGARRRVDTAGLGYGWTHNWQVRASKRTAYEQALGLNGSPYNVASALVAAVATLDLMSVTTIDAQHWMLASLVSNWLTDQLQDNAVGISLGERSLQFIKRPDGAWQPPGGVTHTLTALGGGGGWALTERHGSTYNFDSNGRLTTLVDLWNKTLNVAYNASDKVSSVTDAYGRSLNFGYTGGQLTSVTDSTGRSVNFTVTGGDLLTATDPEGKSDYFTYDVDHRMTQVKNHDNQVVAANVYDSDTGKLVEQDSEGNTGKAWHYYYSPNSTVEVDPQGGTKTYSFDNRGRQVGLMDASGLFTSTIYDGQDRVIQTVSPMGRVLSQVYDHNSNVTSSTDPDGKVTSYSYDNQLRLQTITDPLGHTTTYTYSAQHQPLTITNALGETVTNNYNSTIGTLAFTILPGASSATNFGYNSRDELTTTSYPGGGTQTVVRNVLGDPTSVQDARGNTTTFTYNNRRQVLTTTQPGSLITTNTYNNQGKLASTQDARGNTTLYSYAASGKPTGTTLPDGSTLSNVYDSRDWKSGSINALGKTTNYTYYLNGLLAVQTDALLRPTVFGYDNDSRRTKVQDALGHLISSSYNGRDLVATETDALSQTASHNYDDAGRHSSFTNRRSNTHSFTYNNAGRLLSTTTPGGRSTSQAYNTQGLVATTTEPSSQQTTLTYDARGRVLTSVDGTGSISYAYDNNSNLLTVTQGGVTITRTYDALNRLATYNDGRGHTLGYGYDNNGNLTSLTYEAGKIVSYTYDNRDRLSTVTDWTGRVTTFVYDATGNVLSMARPNGTVRSNTWDDAGQLVNVMDKHISSGRAAVSLKLSYDASGRLQNKFELPLWPATTALPARTMAYNTDNQVSSLTLGGVAQTISYDLDGNVTSAPAPDGTTALQSYGWNTRNQLISAPGAMIYAYDAEGLRTSYTVGSGGSAQTTTFVNDPRGALSQVLWRIRPDGTRTFYIYAPVLLYEIEENANGGNPANAARYYHYDHLGSTLALSNDVGTVTGRASYSTYGVKTQSGGTLNTPFLWNGALGVQTDPNGLHHMRARYYHCYLSRFLSEDPLGLSAGSNVYAYCNGNPVMGVDPDGKFAWMIAGAIIGVAIQGAVDLYHGEASSWQTYAGAAVGGALGGGILGNTGRVAVSVGRAALAGAVSGAGGNATTQIANIATEQQQSFDPVSFAVSTGAGAAGSALGAKVLPGALSYLSNQAKGQVGQAMSLVTNALRGNLPAGGVGVGWQVNLPGQRAIWDWQFRNVFTGAATIVESKFGTAGLTAAQEASALMTPNLSIERWTYGFWSGLGGTIGGSIGGSSGGTIEK